MAQHRTSPGNKANPWKFVTVIASIVLVGALAALCVIGFSYWQGQNQYRQLRDVANLSVKDMAEPDRVEIDWDALRKINADVVGWIMVPGTAIDYPIVQATDNEYYLNHGFNREQNWLASYGAIFLDATNASTFTDDNSVMYGHNMKDGSMFAAIDAMTSQSEFNKHRTAYVFTPQGNLTLNSFAVVVTPGSDAIVQTNFSSPEAKASYIQDKINRSCVSCSDANAQNIAKTNLVALSTCDYTIDDGRALAFFYVTKSTIPSVTGLEQAAVSDKLL